MLEVLEDLDYSLIDGLLRGLMPDPIITVSEWSDTRRILPATSAEPGPFKTSRMPYLREIVDKMSSSDPAQKVIVMKGSQVGFTESGNNVVGYVIDISPNGFLYVMPTDTLMKDTSRTRIEKMIDTTPSIKGKIKPKNSKEGGNTLLNKEFEGGFLKMVGANSPVGLSSVTVRYVYLDEIDRFPQDVGGEGDVIALAETRTSTFGERRKIYATSTPTLEGSSIIHNQFKNTGQRYYHVPCPHCSAMQYFKFTQLRWEKGKYPDVTYQCEHCNDPIQERHKTKMLANGQWQALFPDKEDGYTFGYHLSAMYSPYGMYSWKQMAKDYDEAQGDLPKLIVFTNTKLGEVYKTEGDAPEWESIYNKREPDLKLNTPHEEVVFITAGVDIQKDRIELEIVGWGKGKQSWSIDFKVLLGNTDSEGSPVWAELNKIVNSTWTRTDGAVLHLSNMAIDSGFNTSEVYAYCRKHSVQKVFPIKGQETQALMVSQPRAVDTSRAGKKINSTKVWNVGTSIIKSELYGWLKLQRNEDGSYPPGYCHFPEYDQHYFRSITAEKLERTTDKRGYTVYKWTKKYDRNEALDCRVYARAAAYVLNIDRLTDDQWDKLWMDTKDLIPTNKLEAPTKPKKRGPSIWDR